MKAPIEERQRVASRLSYAAADGTENPLGTLKYILGLGVSDTYRDVFRALAMLIGPGVCEWTVDENGVYRTECGLAHLFEFDGVTENGYRYCPYCGGLIAERKGDDR